MSSSPARPRIIVHSLEHAEAALAVAADLAVPVMLASAAGAGGYAGPLWFKALIAEARRKYPTADAAALPPADAAVDAAQELIEERALALDVRRVVVIPPFLAAVAV